MAWHLKQEQLVELNEILHHENYTDTALAKDNETAEVCAGLNDYIIRVNASTHVFKIEVDTHVQEVIDLKNKMDTAPCPCEWATWSEWSVCSTTCEAGNSHRERVIAKEAINNGEECEGPSSEDRTCNEDVCCRKLKQNKISIFCLTFALFQRLIANGMIGRNGQPVRLDVLWVGDFKKRPGHDLRLLKLSAMVESVMGLILRRRIVPGK